MAPLLLSSIPTANLARLTMSASRSPAVRRSLPMLAPTLSWRRLRTWLFSTVSIASTDASQIDLINDSDWFKGQVDNLAANGNARILSWNYFTG